MRFNGNFLREMRTRLDVDLLGSVSLEAAPSGELRKQAAALLPGAKTVIVMGKEMYKEVVALLAPSRDAGEAAGGDLLSSHGDYLNGRLTRAVHDLARFFKDQGLRSLPLPPITPTDQRFLTPLFSYKLAGHLAGLGSIGRHSLLITPAFGPRERLACVLTEAVLEGSPVPAHNLCSGCNACIDACPSHALMVPEPGKPYSINKFACRAYRQAGLTCGMCIKACDAARE